MSPSMFYRWVPLTCAVAALASACSPTEKEKPTVPIVIVDDADAGSNNGDIVCGPGKANCGDTCVDTTKDSANCGGCGIGCADGSVCSRGACAEIPADCRGEVPCPAQYYCDETTGFCESGCASNEDCSDGSYCELVSHQCLCPTSGEVLCGDTCTPEGPESCGTDCVSCPAPTGGSATCEAGVCGQACSPDDMLCDGACADCPTDGVASTTCQGSSCVAAACQAGHELCDGVCAPCPSADPSAVFGCMGTQCVVTDCPAGTRLCDGECASCPQNTGGSLQCSGSQCTFVCPGGTHECNGVCVPDDDVDNCGASCRACPSDANGSAACSGGSCILACDSDYRECAGACAACPTAAVATTRCAGASCVVDSCVAGSYPCANGCCTPPPDGQITPIQIYEFDAAVDHLGYPHLYARIDGGSRYARWNGQQWVVSSPSVGLNGVRIAVDPTGKAHLAGTNSAGLTLVTDLEAADQTTTRVTTDSTAEDPDIAIDGTGIIHVVWRQRTQSLAKDIKYANSSTGWTVRTAEPSEAQEPVLGLSATTLHLAYYSSVDGQLRHRKLDLGANGFAGYQTITTLGGYDPYDFAVNANDQAVFVWGDFDVSAARYNGATWTNDGEITSTRPYDLEAAVSPAGESDIFYFEGSFDDIEHKRHDGTSWSSMADVPDGTQPQFHYDSMGTGHLIYYAPTTGELVYKRY